MTIPIIDPDTPLRMLISYHYYKGIDLDTWFEKNFQPPYPDVFADSGAFSAMTQGVTINVDEYAAWIKRYNHWFTLYANLDVIRYPERTWQHQVEMEDRHGLTPLPVFHVATPFSWLDHYLDRYPYIGLGVAGTSYRTYMGWAVKCFQAAGDRAVFHGFGITAWKAIRDLPWFSVDSSSWGSGFRFGLIPLFDPRFGRIIKVRLGDLSGWLRHAPLVRSYGFDPLDFADRSRNTREKICTICALTYIRAEQWVRQHHGEVTIPDRDGDDGLRVYLANTSLSGINHRLAARGLRMYLADTSVGTNQRPAARGLRLYLVDSTYKPPDMGLVEKVLREQADAGRAPD